MAIFEKLFKKDDNPQSVDTNLVVTPGADNHNMSLNKYEVKAVYKQTNRVRKNIVFGVDAKDIIQQMQEEYITPFEAFTQLPYDEPTEKQIALAKKKKIKIPKKCCKEDMTALLDAVLRKEDTEFEGKKYKRTEPGKELIAFANKNHIPYSLYAEEPRVIRDVYTELDGEENKIAFMIACLYKHVKGKWNFRKWDEWVKAGSQISQDKTFYRSLESSVGMEWGFYGFDWESISERTKAYQMLKERI